VLGERQIRTLIDGILAKSSAQDTEVLLVEDDNSLTRFAGSEIHQNVSETDVEVRIRVVNDKRTGVAATHDLSASAIQATLEAALEAAVHVPADERYAGLPAPQTISPVQAFVAETAECTPAFRAAQVAAICKMSLVDGLDASGAFSTGVTGVAIGNSNGLFAYEQRTHSDLLTVMTGESSSGYAQRTSMNVAEIDGEAAGREAIDRAVRGRNPIDIEPGTYTVVLEEYAVAEMLDYLSYVAFSGLAFAEKRSLFADHLGEQLFGANITLIDDPRSPASLASSFDYEGVPTRAVTVIDHGVAAAVVHDSMSAALAGSQSTGHGLPAPNTFGPLAGHLILSPGDRDRASLAQGIERGLWITRFHYVNVADPKRAVLTGMTRDGTFLIEHGELTKPVRNLRFTQSVPDALRCVSALSSQTKTIESWVGANVVPALAIDQFTFTSATVG
jgi:PmbA protein